MNAQEEYKEFNHSQSSYTKKLLDAFSGCVQFPEPPFPLGDMAESMEEKYGLPFQLNLFILLSQVAAHTGGNIRMGAEGDFGMPLNLRLAVSMPGNKSLQGLFRTLGKRLYEVEQTAFTDTAGRNGKPFSEKEIGKVIDKAESEDCGKLSTISRMARVASPNVLWDSGSSKNLLLCLERSADNCLYALSDTGGPIPAYLEEYTPSERTELLRLARNASDMAPISQGGEGKASWHYSGKSLLNILWFIERPYLFLALKDHQMAMNGFWHNFALIDCPGLEAVDHVRLGKEISHMKFWDMVVNLPFHNRTGSIPIMIHPDRDADEEFEKFSRFIEGFMGNLPSYLHNPMRHWVTLAQKLSGLLCVAYNFQPGAIITGNYAMMGVSLAKWLGAQTLQIHQSAVESGLTIHEREAEETMLLKIRDKGPVAFRTICRSYRKQAGSIHRPVLDSLMEKGKVEVDGNGLYKLAS